MITTVKENSENFNKTRIANNFDTAASTYEANAVVQKISGERLLERSDLLLMQPTSILDLGCGTGYFTRALTKKYSQAKVTGIDLARKMIDTAQQHPDRSSRERYFTGDIESLPFRDQEFDFVFSNMVLHWMPNPVQAWREIARVLTPGGVLMFTMPGPDTLKECRLSWASVDSYAHVYPFVDMHDIGDFLLSSGFVDPVMDRQDFQIRYGELNSLFRDLKKTGVTNSMPARNHHLTGKSAFLKMKAHYETFKSPDGKYPATYEIIYGHAFQNVSDPESKMNDGEVRISISDIKRR